jgi:hypothetical protein
MRVPGGTQPRFTLHLLKIFRRRDAAALASPPLSSFAVQAIANELVTTGSDRRNVKTPFDET